MISKKALAKINSSSAVRKMFEAGKRLKEELGHENVFDFSLGNPDFEPPVQIINSLQTYINTKKLGAHAYMPNAGSEKIRDNIAQYESKLTNRAFSSEGIIMTVGAAGAINIALNSILDPGDEVIIIKPYFTEYPQYVDQAGGTSVFVDCDERFRPNIDDLNRKITTKTKAIIINSPNNPSGVVYEPEVLQEIQKSLAAIDQTIYCISDEVYRDIIYDGKLFPSVSKVIDNTITIYSWSKSYAIPGERIGYAALPRDVEDFTNLSKALSLYNRTLGFVNAPAIWQHVLAENIGLAIDYSSHYEKRRNAFLEIFSEAGIKCYKSEGTFYLVPEVPQGYTTESFLNLLQSVGILFVDAKGFGLDNNLRVSYAVADDVILRAGQKLIQLMQNN